MNPLFLIPVVVVIGGIAFMIFMNKKHKAVQSEINIDTERTKYDQYKQELLNSDYSKLKQWMKGKPIDAFTSASVPQSLASKVEEHIADGIKKVALSAVGVRLIKVETDCFWVLSENDLHFFTTNTSGELDEHIVFDYFNIEKAKLEYGGILKSTLGVYSKSSEEYLPKTHLITIDLEGSPITLEIHDRINYVVNPVDALNLEKQLRTRAKYQVVGEKFVDVLQNKFPNLKTT